MPKVFSLELRSLCPRHGRFRFLPGVVTKEWDGCALSYRSHSSRRIQPSYESLIDYANEEKRHQNSRDVKRALAERVRAGYSSGGKPPRGYIAKQEIIGTKRNGEPRIGSRWIIDPDLGTLTALAFRLRAEGEV